MILGSFKNKRRRPADNRYFGVLRIVPAIADLPLEHLFRALFLY
jgi:hypothetical protein